MLGSLWIEKFRAFSSLKIDTLGQINLIVGRNNVGKTMLLEALRVYTAADAFEAIRALLVERDEIVTGGGRTPDDEDFQIRVGALFNGRPADLAKAGEVVIGPTRKGQQNLRLSVVPLRRARGNDSPSAYEIVAGELGQEEGVVVPGLIVKWGGNTRVLPLPLLSDRYYRRAWRRTAIGGLPRAPFVAARGVTDREAASWWDAIALRDAESRVTECLRLIAPVDRISMVEHPARPGERMAMVRLHNQDQPVPLKSLGDGMVRLFQVALAGEVSSMGVGETPQMQLFPDREQPTRAPLLVDEIENGVHYTALPRLWEFLFRIAQINGVQIFATSHSWDCIEGFQYAAARNPGVDASLIRLEYKDGCTKAVVFTRDELETVTKERIEVR